MKSIYTLLALLCLTLSASAQRTTKIKAIWVAPDPQDVTTLSCNDSNDVEFIYINLGPGTVQTTDTFWFIYPGTQDGSVSGLLMDAPVGPNDTIAHLEGKMKLSEIKTLADATSGEFVYAPFSAGDYLIFTQAYKFYIGAPSANTLEIDTAGSTIAAGARIKINCPTGIEDLFTSGKTASLQTYPNPTNGLVSFKYAYSNNQVTVKIADITGRVVMVKEFGKQSGEKILSVDVPKLNNGIYYLELIADDRKAVGKITVAK